MTTFIQDAKQRLGIDRFALQIQNASFPSDDEENLGRGTPYSRGAGRFFQFAASLGFDTIQLGPCGMTGRGNPSPYDGTIFSRNPLDLPLLRFVENGRLSRKTFEAIRNSLSINPAGQAPYSQVYDATQLALGEILANASSADRATAHEFLTANETWLIPDALYSPLCTEHGQESWLAWSDTPQGVFDQRLFAPRPGAETAATHRLGELRTRYAKQIEDYALIQWLLHCEHEALRTRLASLNLALYGDMQVGMSLQDAWAWQRLFLPGYLMGAPPSRTNPDGQPWGYAVLDPRQFGTLESPGPALEFVRARVGKVLNECDGLRIDHPHGWVDPWVYNSYDPNPFHAVQNGARLFSTPDDVRHTLLHEFAIARADQLDPAQPGYADHRVTALDGSQVACYSLLFDVISELQTATGRPPTPIACEVLSTLPFQLGKALARHQMGRFRVTQKITLSNSADVYRIEHAAPGDWIMLGTHDTPSTWELARLWCQGEAGDLWGEYLAPRLVPKPEQAAEATRIARHPGELIHALFAGLLGSQARNVVLFFPDLFGMIERYNQPGVISEENWSLRLPSNFEEFYEQRREQDHALDVIRCFQRALQAQQVGLPLTAQR